MLVLALTTNSPSRVRVCKREPAMPIDLIKLTSAPFAPTLLNDAEWVAAALHHNLVMPIANERLHLILVRRRQQGRASIAVVRNEALLCQLISYLYFEMEIQWLQGKQSIVVVFAPMAQ